MTERHHIVRERDGRELEFDGELLGSASSREYARDPTRWAEISIYRTTMGRYITVGIGRSTRPGETDRCWAHVCETPEGAIEDLYAEDADGVRYLTRVNREAIRQATLQDDELDRAFSREVVT